MIVHSQKSESATLPLRQVIDGGYCIGCGLCAHILGSDSAACLNDHGMFQPNLDDFSPVDPGTWAIAAHACPFTDIGPNEDEIAERHFSDLARDEKIGRYRRLFVGRIADTKRLKRATSGGIITWVLCRLLAEGLVDYVVHVQPSEPGSDLLFSYGISSSAQEIIEGGKSRYYPIELSGVLKQIESRSGVCVVVGLPCFLKGLRRLVESRPSLGRKIKFYIGLVCGHLKSAAFADCLAWQMGVAPGQADAVDFRVKFEDGGAADYGFAVTENGRERVRRVRGMLGSDWGINLFRYSACNYCDDVFAECADLVVGDAWLPGYMDDPDGHSVVVTRHPLLDALLSAGRSEHELLLNHISKEDMIESQSGALRDRREGLRYRLFLQKEEGKWTPTKRVTAESRHLNRPRRGIFRARLLIGMISHDVWRQAVAAGDYNCFGNRMKMALQSYYDWYKPWWKRPLASIYRWWQHRASRSS